MNHGLFLFATDNLKNPDDVFCFDTQTGQILLLWVLAADPFNPPDWQYNKLEVADNLEEFIKQQSELAGVKIITPTIAPEQKLPVKAGLKTTKPILINGGILLYYLETEDCKSTIQAYFNVDNDLIIDGYDIGKFVEEYFGDSDYEYKMTVPSKQITELNKLFNIPPDSKQELLYELTKRYNTGTCFSEIKEFLDNNHIKYDYFSWT